MLHAWPYAAHAAHAGEYIHVTCLLFNISAVNVVGAARDAAHEAVHETSSFFRIGCDDQYRPPLVRCTANTFFHYGWSCDPVRPLLWYAEVFACDTMGLFCGPIV